MVDTADDEREAGSSSAATERIAAYRHRWEMRMVALGVLVAVVAVVVVAILTVNHASVPGWLNTIALAALAAPPVVALAIGYNFWKVVVDAVEVTDGQYPELKRIFDEQVVRGGFDWQPRLYVTNGNGVLNAFASKGRLDVRRGGYVVVYSDIVDTFYELGDEDLFRFVISHELGHLRLGHINVRRSVLASVLAGVFLGKSLTRAQEYSADRFGASITDGIALHSLSVLYAGKRVYRDLDLDRYIDHDTTEINPFWVGVVNFRSDHAVGRRRLAAARLMDRGGWDVHGRML